MCRHAFEPKTRLLAEAYGFVTGSFILQKYRLTDKGKKWLEGKKALNY
jgi:hypothetical protein